MKCNFCGKEIKDGSVFCKYCGNKIEPVAENTILPVADIQDKDSCLCGEKCVSKDMNAIQSIEDNTTEKVGPIISCEKEEGKKKPLSSREKKIIIVFSGIIVCLLIVIIALPIRPIFTKSESKEYLKDADIGLNSQMESIPPLNNVKIDPSESNQKTVPTTNDLGTAQSVSFGFVDYTMFSEHWTEGMYRCGADFPAGEYYILSLWGANALYDVADSPNDFSYSHHRMFRKITAKEGQYIQLSFGSLMVKSEEFKNRDLKEYGIFLVGKDLSAGDYKITTITDRYNTELYDVSGINGGYQISNNSPENDSEKCGPLFDKQTYISVEDGQYIILANANMILAGA